MKEGKEETVFAPSEREQNIGVYIHGLQWDFKYLLYEKHLEHHFNGLYVNLAERELYWNLVVYRAPHTGKKNKGSLIGTLNIAFTKKSKIDMKKFPTKNRPRTGPKNSAIFLNRNVPVEIRQAILSYKPKVRVEYEKVYKFVRKKAKWNLNKDRMRQKKYRETIVGVEFHENHNPNSTKYRNPLVDSEAKSLMREKRYIENIVKIGMEYEEEMEETIMMNETN